jgi:hypothetical protein
MKGEIKFIYKYDLSQKNLGRAKPRWRDNIKMDIKRLAGKRIGYYLTERHRCVLYNFNNISRTFMPQSSG